MRFCIQINVFSLKTMICFLHIFNIAFKPCGYERIFIIFIKMNINYFFARHIDILKRYMNIYAKRIAVFQSAET